MVADWQPQTAVSTHKGKWVLPLLAALLMLLSFYQKQHRRLSLPSLLGPFLDTE